MIGLIRTTTHDRIVAAKDAEIAGLMKRLDAMSEKCSALTLAEMNSRTLAEMNGKALELCGARLDRFTTLRKRDAAGRFVPDDAGINCAFDQLMGVE